MDNGTAGIGSACAALSRGKLSIPLAAHSCTRQITTCVVSNLFHALAEHEDECPMLTDSEDEPPKLGEESDKDEEGDDNDTGVEPVMESARKLAMLGHKSKRQLRLVTVYVTPCEKEAQEDEQYSVHT